jgi:DcuC family C4-dicarboxylate transporter
VVSLVLGVLIIAAAIVAILRRVDVRLALFVAALALGVVAGNPAAIIRTFFNTFANERFVVPICMAMGFAYVLRQTECDQHLVHLLVRPLLRVRWALIPGTVLVGFVVNIPIISQTSTAATLGAVVIPILLAARVSPVTVGAALLLGCSIGGELLNPGAPELRTIVEETQKAWRSHEQPLLALTSQGVVEQILPFNLLGLCVGTLAFWWLSTREEASQQQPGASLTARLQEVQQDVADFRVNPFKATIPLLPLILLFLTGPPLNLLAIPTGWLVPVPQRVPAPVALIPALAPPAGFPGAVPWPVLTTADVAAPVPGAVLGLFSSRLIGAAMLVGVVVAAVSSWRSALQVPRAFFEGAGYGFANIISLIVTANCFGEGISLIGLADLIGHVTQLLPWLLLPSSGAVPLGFGVVCGSGMASTQSLFRFFVEPSLAYGVDPTLVGAVVALASAAGRTMSPVAAVTLMCATMTSTSPFELVRRVALPLLLSVVVIVLAAFMVSLW